MFSYISKLKKITTHYNLTILCIPTFFLVSLFTFLILHFKEFKSFKNIQNSMMKIPVNYPKERPKRQEKDIALAMALFSINIPENVCYPTYSYNLPYRGLTRGNSFFPQKEVIIGEMAFTSWGILGSTLAHEIEIHGNQSFLKIEFLNFLYSYIQNNNKFIYSIFPSFEIVPYENMGLGSYLAEKEAYSYEINSDKRFNLKIKEILAIKNTLEHELI